MIKKSNIYKMQLHEEYHYSRDIWILRVPGGWLYNTKNISQFVPYDNEFDPARKGYVQPSARGNPMPWGLPPEDNKPTQPSAEDKPTIITAGEEGRKTKKVNMDVQKKDFNKGE